MYWGSGCGSVSKAVASETRGPWLESPHQRSSYWTLLIVNCIEKTKIKKKRPGMPHFFNTYFVFNSNVQGLFTFYALTTGGKSKGMVVRYHLVVVSSQLSIINLSSFIYSLWPDRDCNRSKWKCLQLGLLSICCHKWHGRWSLQNLDWQQPKCMDRTHSTRVYPDQESEGVSLWGKNLWIMVVRKLLDLHSL